MKFTLLAISLSIASNSIIHAEDSYVAPQANKIMFQVDKLPIDKGIRKHLSINLTTLAKRSHDGSAQEHRLTAQLLMLAIRLDRENISAVELNQNLSKGGVLPVSDVQAKVDALKKLKRMIEMLTGTDKLSEGRVLEVYLKDVYIALDGNSPLAATHKENLNRWDGVVPVFVRKNTDLDKPKPAEPVEAGNENDMPDKPNIPNSADGEEEELGSTELDINEKKQEFTKWTKHNSGITTPLIFVKQTDDKLEYSHVIATMYTQISPRVKLESILSLELKPWAKPDRIEVFQKYLNPLMKEQFGEYESLQVEITTSGQLSEKSDEKILLPLCLQLKASEKNIQIRDGIAVLGKLSGKEITRNIDFWHLLKILRKSDAKNQRLLIPFSAEADLRQLVALEEEDFFVRYEVLLVSNIDESVDLLAQSSIDAVKEASEEFSKIQQMIGMKSVGPFAVNKKVRARLEGILAKNPNHLSAKMILLRGGVSRSRKLDSYFIADELSVLLKETSYLNDKDKENLNAESLVKLAKKIEETVEELYPFVDSEDRELVTYLTDIADFLETISRAKGKRESIAIDRTITNALNNFKIKYLEAKTHFDSIMSSPPTT